MERCQKIFAAKKEIYPEILSFILQQAKEAGLSDLLTLQFAVEEIVVNIISYAYPPDVNGELEVECWVEQERFYLQLSDWGIEFNPLNAVNKPVEASLEDMPVGGLGIFLTAKLLDDMNYSRAEEKNILQLSFAIN